MKEIVLYCMLIILGVEFWALVNWIKNYWKNNKPDLMNQDAIITNAIALTLGAVFILT